MWGLESFSRTSLLADRGLGFLSFAVGVSGGDLQSVGFGVWVVGLIHQVLGFIGSCIQKPQDWQCDRHDLASSQFNLGARGCL